MMVSDYMFCVLCINDDENCSPIYKTVGLLFERSSQEIKTAASWLMDKLERLFCLIRYKIVV